MQQEQLAALGNAIDILHGKIPDSRNEGHEDYEMMQTLEGLLKEGIASSSLEQALRKSEARVTRQYWEISELEEKIRRLENG